MDGINWRFSLILIKIMLMIIQQHIDTTVLPKITTNSFNFVSNIDAQSMPLDVWRAQNSIIKLILHKMGILLESVCSNAFEWIFGYVSHYMMHHRSKYCQMYSNIVWKRICFHIYQVTICICKMIKNLLLDCDKWLLYIVI